MTRKFLLFVCAFTWGIVYAGTSYAGGAPGFYFAGYRGLKVPVDTPKLNAFSDKKSQDTRPDFENMNGGTKRFAGALGFRLASNIRLEGDFSYERATPAGAAFKGDDSPLEAPIRTSSMNLNFYYDFDLSGKLKPFIGVSAGYVSGFAADDGNNDRVFIAGMGTGFNYQATDDVSFSGIYHFTDQFTQDNPEADSTSFAETYRGHEFKLGMKYQLPYKPKPKARAAD
jgi:opacity protein-like surface antigen